MLLFKPNLSHVVIEKKYQALKLNISPHLIIIKTIVAKFVVSGFKCNSPLDKKMAILAGKVILK